MGSFAGEPHPHQEAEWNVERLPRLFSQQAPPKLELNTLGAQRLSQL